MRSFRHLERNEGSQEGCQCRLLSTVSARPSSPPTVIVPLSYAALWDSPVSWTLQEPLTSLHGTHLNPEARVLSTTQIYQVQVIVTAK